MTKTNSIEVEPFQTHAQKQEIMSILDCVQATMTVDEFAVFCLELLKIADVDLKTVGIF